MLTELLSSVIWFSLYTNTRSKHNYWTSLSDHHCTILHKRVSCDWYGVGSMDVEPVFRVFRADLGPACVHHTQRGYTSSDKMWFLWNNQKQERMLWEAGANTRSVQGSQTGGYGFINTSVVALKKWKPSEMDQRYMLSRLSVFCLVSMWPKSRGHEGILWIVHYCEGR